MGYNYKGSDNIYQRKGSSPGYTVKDGMLINNVPDGMTLIQVAAQARRAARRAEQVSMIADGTYLGYSRGEMMEGMNGEDCCK